jgi:spore maturation protein SpmB
VTTSDVSGTVRVGFGVDCEHELLLLIRPYSSGGSLGASSEIIEVRTKPAITAITSTAVDVSSMYVSWTGSYSTVDLLWNTTGVPRIGQFFKRIDG